VISDAANRCCEWKFIGAVYLVIFRCQVISVKGKQAGWYSLNVTGFRKTKPSMYALQLKLRIIATLKYCPDTVTILLEISKSALQMAFANPFKPWKIKTEPVGSLRYIKGVVWDPKLLHWASTRLVAWSTKRYCTYNYGLMEKGIQVALKIYIYIYTI